MDREEDEHAGSGGNEEEAATETVGQDRREDCPEEIPNLQNTVDEELDRGGQTGSMTLERSYEP